MEKKLKHLEFIQSAISRINSNSLLIKGWTITLISALFALAAQGANEDYVLISYFILPVFWGLDGMFLSIEKRFIDLYNDVARKRGEEIDFNMDTSSYKSERTGWFYCTFSKTLVPFYGVTLIAVLLVMFLIN